MKISREEMPAPRNPLGSRWRRRGGTVRARAAAGVPEPQVVPLPDGSTLYNFTGEPVPVPGAGGAPAPAAAAAFAARETKVEPPAPPAASPASGRAPFPGREPFPGRAPFKGRTEELLAPFNPDALAGPPPAPEPTDWIAALAALGEPAEASLASGRAPFPGREPFPGRAPFKGRTEELLAPFVGLPAAGAAEPVPVEAAPAPVEAAPAPAAEVDVSGLSWSGEASTAAIFEDEGREAAAEVDVSGLSWSGEASTAAIFEENESDQADLAKLTVKELKALLKEKGKAVSGKALCTLFGQ